ncbi:hypothetical protein VP01_496g18 [Puccinia sorghi]|uniref:Uncharacterized protein n=1 Tax=Puccinia sorghi TaxID=27349 RepID=A0A0L6ULX3_9BASI|nr:hypothetical protein VP01_496g18 [Puccinia sorghi]
MPKIHPLTLNIGCASSFFHVGQVATAAVFRKREPQKTNPENGTAGIASSTSDKAPLVVYASDSTPTPSPTITNRSVLLVALSGASAFSLITLAFVMIYRRYKAHKFGISRSGEGRPSGLGRGSNVQKSQIRHVTHDEQKRYRSLFGVPAGYLRPKSLAPQPTIHALQTAVRSSAGSSSQDDYESKHGKKSSSSLEMHDGGEAIFYQISPTESEFYIDRSRQTRVVSIVDDSPRQIWNLRSTSVNNELPISYFSHRLPALVARLKSIKPKTSYRSKSIKRTHTSSRVKPLQLDLKALAKVDSIQPEARSPSIISTPPSLIKSPSDEDFWMQKPLDLTILTERLECHATAQPPTFRGRADSYYWKSPPKLE